MKEVKAYLADTFYRIVLKERYIFSGHILIVKSLKWTNFNCEMIKRKQKRKKIVKHCNCVIPENETYLADTL